MSEGDHVDRRLVLAGIGLAGAAAIARSARAGQLAPPPGTIAPTMKNLAEVEPRASINTLPGSANAVHRIDTPGSYVLTDDVTGQPGRSGIEIAVSGVSIDLRGFAVRGVAGAVSGVVALGPVTGVSVSNGSVLGWPALGVALTSVSGVRLAHLDVSENGAGIEVGASSAVYACVMRANLGRGLSAGDGALIAHCTASGQGGRGIEVAGASRIDACLAIDNGDLDIYAAASSAISSCVVRGHGIEAHEGSLVEGCSCSGGSGIGVGMRCVVRGCHVSQATIGIRVLPGFDKSRVIDNDVMDCSTGIEASSPCNLIMANSVASGLTPFSIVAGNAFGPIVNVLGGGDLSQIPEGSDPTANRLYS